MPCLARINRLLLCGTAVLGGCVQLGPDFQSPAQPWVEHWNTPALELAHPGMLVLGQDLGQDLVDAQVGRHRPGDLASVASDHRYPDPELVELIDSLA